MIEIGPIYKVIYPHKIHVKTIEDHHNQHGEYIGFIMEFFEETDLEKIMKKPNKDVWSTIIDFNILYVYENCFSLMCEFTMCTYRKVNELSYIFYIGYCKRIENPDEAIPYIRTIKIDSILD